MQYGIYRVIIYLIMFKISSFSIKRLFGHKDVSLQFKDKVQIYIGENGLGKTTVLNAFNYILTLDWKELSYINFEEISIVVNKTKYVFLRSKIEAYLKRQENSRRSGFAQHLSEGLTKDDLLKLKVLVNNSDSIEKMRNVQSYLSSHGYRINASSRFIYESVIELLSMRDSFKEFEDFSFVISSERPQILYYTTYRRVEKNLAVILRRLMEKDSFDYRIPRYIREDFEEAVQSSKFIHFGMGDVKREINDICDIITKISREKLDALSTDLLKAEINGFKDNNRKFSQSDKDKLHSILNRRHIGLIDNEKKNIWKNINDNSIYNEDHKALFYLLSKLVEIYDSYAKYDVAIKRFCNTCNDYLFEKAFSFDEESLQLKLFRNVQNKTDEAEIELEQLSSGEKQIVSLFADVYLNHIDDNFIFLIDEPELSLSIFWQKRLLPDVMESDKCSLLFAVTHSPFIFENKYEDNTVGLNEFMSYSK